MRTINISTSGIIKKGVYELNYLGKWLVNTLSYLQNCSSLVSKSRDGGPEGNSSAARTVDI